MKMKNRSHIYDINLGTREVGGRGGGLALFLFNFLEVYHFYFHVQKLKLLYSLQNCVTHLKKNYFFLPTKMYEKMSF